MSMEQTSYTSSKPTVSDASLEDRLEFIRNTYLHLGLAIFAFVGFEYVLFATGIADAFANFVFSYSISWIGILVLFMIVGNVANRWAHSDATPGLARGIAAHPSSAREEERHNDTERQRVPQLGASHSAG